MTKAAAKAEPAPSPDSTQVPSLNQWFLALPEGRQKVLIEDKWMLAQAAYEAGQALQSAPVGVARLNNLLAVIHRDGGHYLDEHGADKAFADAEAKVFAWLARDDGEAQPVGSALTDEQIERHKLRAGDCPPNSEVLLVSGVKRLQAKNLSTPPAERQGEPWDGHEFCEHPGGVWKCRNGCGPMLYAHPQGANEPAEDAARWISIDDEVPPYSVRVIICRALGGPPFERTVGYRKANCTPEWKYDDGESCRGVSHWMPLPTPPKAEAERKSAAGEKP